MKHLTTPFTWQDYLDWAEDVAPDAPLAEVQRLFDHCAAAGVIRPIEVSEDGEFVYELRPDMGAYRKVEIIVMKGLN